MFSSYAMRRVSMVPGVRRSASGLVTSEIRGQVGILTLNDPARLNALTAAMGEEFTAAVDEMNMVGMCTWKYKSYHHFLISRVACLFDLQEVAKQNIRTCIVTGAGDAFSAGGDIGANYKI